MNDSVGRANVLAMSVHRAIALLIALCAACPSWGAPALRWQVCDGARTGRCRTVTPEYLSLAAPLTMLTTVVHVPLKADENPLVVEIDAMASETVRWNGAVIGTNGMPGRSRTSEMPGRYSASLPVPKALVRPGANQVVIVLSSHRLWFPVGQPIHRIEIGPGHDAEAYTLRHYLPTLVTLALPACGLLALAALLVVGRIGRAAIPVMAVLGAIVVQGLIEVSKIAVTYTYPWHLARMVSLTALTIIVGMLLVGLASRLFIRSRTAIVVSVAGMAMGTACLIVGGPDRQSLAAFEIAILAVAVVAAPAALSRDRRAILPMPITVALALWAYFAGPDFLDAGYYVSAAGAAVALGLTAILRPVPIREISVPAPAVEPTMTLRDGARHHVITPSQLIFLKADDDYCSLHMVDGRELLVTRTLKAVLALLPPGFVRIHRSYAINVRHLRVTRAGANGRLAELSGGNVLPIGRAYAPEIHATTEITTTPA